MKVKLVKVAYWYDNTSIQHKLGALMKDIELIHPPCKEMILELGDNDTFYVDTIEQHISTGSLILYDNRYTDDNGCKEMIENHVKKGWHEVPKEELCNL